MTYITGEVKIPNFTIESGFHFDEVTLAYERCGSKEAPVILVCHSLKENQFTVGTEEKPGWWKGLIHNGGYVDTNKYQIITFNVFGGCNGSTGPSIIVSDGEKYDNRFPKLTVRDLVEIQYIALRILGIDELKAVIGGSFGGMQVLEWGLMYPDFMEAIFPIAATHYMRDEAIEFGYVFAEQQENINQNKSLKRFTDSFQILLDVMKSHDISRDRGSLEEAIKLFQAPIFALGFKKDPICPPNLIKDFVTKVNEQGGYAEFFEIDTKFGHDGFLVEFDKWGYIIKEKLISLEKIEV